MTDHTKKVVCVFDYADLDGICSAAIVYKKYPGAVFIPWRYGEPVPMEEIHH